MARFQERIAGNALYLLAQLTRRTARYQVAGLDYLAESNRNGATIMAAWHGMTMMLAGFFLNYYDLKRLILILPDDWRGAALSVWVRKLGAEPFQMNVKGETSMATARQLSRLLGLVREGRDLYLTPDGPDGPAYAPKPGVAYLAQKTGASLLPVGAYTRTGYRLNRWDQYLVPYPYSRIAIVIGPPLPIANQDELTAVTQLLTAALHGVTAQAAANYYTP